MNETLLKIFLKSYKYNDAFPALKDIDFAKYKEKVEKEIELSQINLEEIYKGIIREIKTLNNNFSNISSQALRKIPYIIFYDSTKELESPKFSSL